jgi:hypothetical protein
MQNEYCAENDEMEKKPVIIDKAGDNKKGNHSYDQKAEFQEL